MLSQIQIKRFQEEGYLLVKGLFSAEEVEKYKRHFEQMRLDEQLGDLSGEAEDPLAVYPRIMMPHRRDETSLDWLIDRRLNLAMTDMLGVEPFAVQTMFYFKPPGARGQALHQDQYYLRVNPGTCIAAWMAVDDCDEANGCLRVVPGSQDWPLMCMSEADTELSFTDVTIELPEGETERPIPMEAGDVLFFNGQIVHGSLPNTSSDRFRRSLIGHYIVGEAEQVHQWYHPVLRMDGTLIEFEVSKSGGTCGAWVTKNGQPELEMQVEILRDW